MTVWLTARSAGLAALVLLSMSTAIGALLSSRMPRRASGRVLVQYLHRVSASLGLGLMVAHIGTVLADSYAHVGVTGAIVPFTSGYRATWVGLGTLAAYCFVLVAAVGFARGRLAASARGAALWRGVHASAYAGWVLAVGHGFMSGTDSRLGWVRLLYLACIVAVLGAVGVRVPASLRTPAAQPSALARRVLSTSGASR